MEINKDNNDDADTVLDTGSDNETIPEVQKKEPVENLKIKPKKEISNCKLIDLILIDTLCKQPNLWFMQCGHIIRPYFRPIHIDSNKSSEFRRDEQYNPFRNTNTKFPKIYNEEMIELINRIKIDILEDESVLSYTDPSGVVRRPHFRRSSTDPIIAPSRSNLNLVVKPIVVDPKPILMSKPTLTGKRKLNESIFKSLFGKEEEYKEEEEAPVYTSQAKPIELVFNDTYKKAKIVPVASKKPNIVPVPPPPPPLLPVPSLLPHVSTLINKPQMLVKDCRYGTDCHRTDCIFRHPNGYIPQPYMCRSDKKCHNFSCKYKHSDGYIPYPILRCRYGNKCDIKKTCYYSHPDDKWWNSIK